MEQIGQRIEGKDEKGKRKLKVKEIDAIERTGKEKERERKGKGKEK